MSRKMSSEMRWDGISSQLIGSSNGNGRLASGGNDLSALARSTHDYERAFELLEIVSEALEAVQNSREKLALSLRDVTHKSENDLATAEKKIQHWKHRTEALEEQGRNAQEHILALQQRIDLTEAALKLEKERLLLSEQKASTATLMATNFHDKILAAFGKGSRIHTKIASDAELKFHHVEAA